MSNATVPAVKRLRPSVRVRAGLELGGVMAALVVTEKASAMFSPLQSAAGGLLAIAVNLWEAYRMQDIIDELEGYIRRLNTVLDAKLSRLSPDHCPETLKNKMAAMASEIETVRLRIQDLKPRSWLRRFLEADRIQSQGQDMTREIGRIIDTFITDAALDIERAVAELADTVDQGGMDGRLDELGQVIKHDGLLSPHHAVSARFDHYTSIRVECEQGTRGEILHAIYRWLCPDDPYLATEVATPDGVTVPTGTSIFWLSGEAGSGKSTIAQTVAGWCDHRDRHCLAASFFCSRDSDECSNVRLIFPTIAYQLGVYNQSFRERLADTLRADRDVEQASEPHQLEKLIIEPLGLVPDFPPCTIIIDALDECKDNQAPHRILAALSHWVPRLQPIKFIITSRPEQNMHGRFHQEGLVNCSLHEIPPAVAEGDIREYLRRRFAVIANTYKIRGGWPSAEELEDLVKQAHGLFVIAATALKYIRPGLAGDPEEQLTALLQSGRLSSSTTPYAHLDALYLHVLVAAFSGLETTSKERLQLVLGFLVLLRDKLSSRALSELLDFEPETMGRSLRRLHSLIVIPDSTAGVLQLIHPSLHDFLVDPSRCLDRRFAIEPKLHHTRIAEACLRTLNLLLRRDICNIGDSSKLNIDVPDLKQRITSYIPTHLQYACRHWNTHLVDGDIDEGLLHHLESFCEHHLLHWLEVMSLLGALKDAFEGLISVQAALQSLPHPPYIALDLLYDCERILGQFRAGLGMSCLQAYYGVVPFCPTNTVFHQIYSGTTSNVARLVQGAQRSWNTCARTVEGDTAAVRSVAFSPQHGEIVSSASNSTVRLWNVHSGVLLQVFAGHAGEVTALAFHPMGRLVFSGLSDGTIVIWDTLTGGILNVLRDERSSCQILALACSSDGALLASGSADGRVYLWNTGEPFTLQSILGDLPASSYGPDTDTFTLAFSRDGRYIVCAGGTGTCTAWDIHEQSDAGAYAYQDAKMHYVALSPDDDLLACGTVDGAVVVWRFHNPVSPLHVLEHSRTQIRCVQFSPKGDILATGCSDNVIYLWSAISGQCVNSLLGHTDHVNDISFAPDGRRVCSASNDHTLRIWEMRSDLRSPAHSSTNTSRPRYSKQKILRRLLGLSPSALFEEVSPGENSRVTPVMVAHRDVEHHAEGPVRAVAISSDGESLATGAGDGLIKLWSTQTGQLLREFIGHDKLVSCISFSFDGRSLASGGYFDHHIFVWDPHTGHATIAKGHDGAVLQVSVLRGHTGLISCSDDGTLRWWRVDTTEERDRDRNRLQTWRSDILSHDTSWKILAFALSDDEKLVAFSVTLSRTRRGAEVLVLDFTSRTVIWSLSYGVPIPALAFASDGFNLAALDYSGLVHCFNIFQPSRIPDVYDRRFNVPSIGGGSQNIKFSHDGRWIITDFGIFESHPSERSTAHTIGAASPSFPDTSFLHDEWLWKTPLSGGPPRRVCWVPTDYRFRRTDNYTRQGGMVIHNDLVALGTENGRVVLIDLSQTLS